MSVTLIENKTLHIVSEFVVILGVSYHFHRKNKQLTNYIEDLSHRIDEQEEQLKKHEIILEKILGDNNISSKKKNTRFNKKIEVKTILPQESDPESEEESTDLDEELKEELSELNEDSENDKEEKSEIAKEDEND